MPALVCRCDKGIQFLSRLLLAWCDVGIRFSIRPFLCQFINICGNPNFDTNVQVHFRRNIKATVMIPGISLHLGITTRAAISIFDLDLYFTVHRLREFAWRDIAFGRILVSFHQWVHLFIHLSVFPSAQFLNCNHQTWCILCSIHCSIIL